MSKRTDTLKLGLFLRATGHHIAAWRDSGSQADAGIRLDHFIEMARKAEAAGFDTLFLADSVSVRGIDAPTFDRVIAPSLSFEPLTLLSALATVTSRIGLIATASTSYSEPFNLARQFASLDQISGGRVGWNLVTSSDPDAAKNFGGKSEGHQAAHADRYSRAREFHEVVDKLWDSWEDDTLLLDKEKGLFLDRSKLHVADHHGEHFHVRGPLNVLRSPQGKPVLVQAGASQDGRALAAATAEAIFAAHQSLADAQAFYSDIKSRAAVLGRNPGHIKILPGVTIFTAATSAQAHAKHQRLQDLVHPQVGLSLLSGLLGGVDLSNLPLDGPLPQDLPATNASKSRQQLILQLAAEGLSIRELYLRLAGARGHWTLVGSPEEVVDQLQAWFEGYGADGFNILPPTYPQGLDDFIALILPELKRRGLVPEDGPTGSTLRERLGLPVPEHPARLLREHSIAV
ncbi:LLM class flavin-dependent oxidoreductase [Pseudomonas sp. LP_7_YM]|uniref:LLM class flavin-dependent oxidoreductase n=1 Tax=Pseudomonas sp. LP_7_YM TaxID=2485137 RepID=UPI00105C2DD8|nr:LLM class flavin-dependent oxidoreductase [Pseudomonas sp. LP_7_YM]TDV72728.1 FMN-dependent oxidoreductase (nitrilotriacetate monooxygenase family) [Pseudomonas sp. LP_7_YM]